MHVDHGEICNGETLIREWIKSIRQIKLHHITSQIHDTLVSTSERPGVKCDTLVIRTVVNRHFTDYRAIGSGSGYVVPQSCWMRSVVTGYLSSAILAALDF